MDRAQLYKLTELIVAEVVRRIAQEERRRQHPEQVLVLLADMFLQSVGVICELSII